ncbi:chemotaxis protein CheW [Coleofasciculus sp. FACHB-T130]|uniref:chemotaxis protein CheW n=1 Tax=Cyanophyceae TaxID=3028117 RepID=UPI0016889A2E|nr:chemotaxis protein CheW [Coleofasciculus sp. FACHB-T130]MBD1880116.1 purine-binding chemotaxis protein CheW [Coleofasciculus sp. FACHB-T130]
MESEFLSGNKALIQQFEIPTAEHKAVVGEQFLRFHLFPDITALFPMHQMTEVLTIPVGQIVPIPHMPPWVMGVYNWRGEILWIADLGHLVGLTPLYLQAINRSTYTVIVIHGEQQILGKQRTGSQIIGKKMLGLVVNRVEDIESCDPDLIQSPPQSSVTPELVPFLRGYWLKSNGEILVVLEGESIMAGMPKPEV